jgi:RimJ/RimL family protein N-acetyltransferase
MSIATPRLVLRALSRASPRQVAWLRDPEVVRFSEQRHRSHTLSSQLRYVTSFAGRSRFWGIFRIEDDEQIGNVTAMVDEPNDVAEVGILIGDKSAWRRGFGAEAWTAACLWLLDKNGGAIRKLEAGCMRANEPMMKILAKSRFVHEGERANHFLLGGSPTGMALFGRFR